MPEEIIPQLIEEEMKHSYLDYSMSVIISRALPDVRDGLKPVHRRILIAMNDLNLAHNKRFRKCAKICGDVSGNYHPHGESVVYPALVRLAQDFSMRYPLIDGQGNFGSQDGDFAAAMRYTEARLKKLSEELLKDLDKDTVAHVPNYDSTLKEPVVLPAKAPNLLINGSSGIAVGMATNMPPHNILEVCNGVIQTIDNPDITIPELIQIIKAPDFPTGAIISGKDGIEQAYKTGRGKITVRAQTQIEESKNKTKIIVTEIPYQVNKAHLIEHIAELVREKKLEGISDLRDESDKEGIRVVIELKQSANPEVVLNQLYKHTKLRTTFGILMLALVDKAPKVLNLKQLIDYFIKHRFEIVTKRTEFELNKAEERSHILAGLIITLDDIDNAIRLIKQSENVGEARIALTKHFKLTLAQVQAVLDMKLQKLTSLEQDKIREEQKSLLQKIEEYKGILADKQKVYDIIKAEQNEIKETYGDERRTQILEMEEKEFEAEDLIEEEDMVVTITHYGYIKRLPLETYKQQKRGGKGVLAIGTREKDFVEHLFIANTHAYMLFFTDKGKLHWLKVHQLPQAGRQAKGTPIVNLLHLAKDERITAFVPVKEFDNYLMMSTKKGLIKKTSLSEFAKPRKGGIMAIGLAEGDELINVKLTTGNQQIIVATQNGRAVRFDEKDIRPTGRTSKGVRGIKLKTDDKVIGMVVADENKDLFTITNKGYGKRTPIKDYRLITRGGSGVINLKVTEKNGKAVSIKEVIDTDELMLISKKGIVIRIPAKDISTVGRNSQGVRVMKISEDDRVVSAAKIVTE